MTATGHALFAVAAGLRHDDTPGWHVRRWFLVAWLVLLQPSTAPLGVVYLHPVGRPYILRFLNR